MRKKNLGLLLGATALVTLSVVSLTSCGKKSVDFKSYDNEVIESEFNSKIVDVKFASNKSYSADVFLYYELETAFKDEKTSGYGFVEAKEKVDFENSVGYSSIEMNVEGQNADGKDESYDEKYEITAQLVDSNKLAVADMNNKEYIEASSMSGEKGLRNYFRVVDIDSYYAYAKYMTNTAGGFVGNVNYYVDGNVYTMAISGSVGQGDTTNSIDAVFQVEVTETSAFFGFQCESHTLVDIVESDLYCAEAFNITYGKQEVSKVDLTQYKMVETINYLDPFFYLRITK